MTHHLESSTRLAKLFICGALAIFVTAGCKRGLTFEETGPSLNVQMVVPPGFPSDLVAGGEIVISASTDEVPKFLSGTGFFQLNGVQVAVQTRDENGDGKPDVVVSFGTNPLRDSLAEIYLYARLAPGIDGSFTPTPPLKVDGRLHASDGTVIASGVATVDSDGEMIRFGPHDRRVLVPMACVSQEACNAPVIKENVRISVSRAPNCPGPTTAGVVYALLDPRSSTGAAAMTRTLAPVQLTPGTPIDLPPVEVLPGIYRVTAILDTTGEFEARGRVEAAGDLITSLRKTVDVFEGWDSRVDLVLDRVVDVGSCFGATTQPAIAVATEPRSPANNNSPRVRGTALPGARVRLYQDASCTQPLGEGSADPSGLFEIEISVADNSTTEIYATATDLDGAVSTCTGGVLSYIEDSAPPAPPPPGTLSTEPASPSTVVVPLLRGTIESGALIAVHLAADCSDSPAGFGSAAQLEQGLRVAVAPNALSHLYLRLTDTSGNASDCLDSGVTYRHDVIAPEPPTTIQISPAPPAASTTPTLSGTIEDGATVEIFANGTCGGTGVTGSAQEFQAGLTVPVSENTATTFSLRVTDATGNRSSCITVALVYVHDSVPPALPVNLSTEPAGPSSVATPLVRGTLETGASAEIYVTGDCSGAPVSAKSADLASGVAVPVAANQTTTFSFVVIDSAGNRSACLVSSLTYLHDSEAPGIPPGAAFTTVPSSPAMIVAPNLVGTVEAGSTVSVHLTSDCSDAAAASGSALQLAAGIAVPLPANTASHLYVVVTDAAGNASVCLDTGVVYVHDLIAPPAPTALAIAPTPPASTLTPSVSGTIEARATVQIYTDLACAGTPVIGTAAQLSAGISVTVAANTTTALAVRVTDEAGNTSICLGTNLTYTHDSLIPGLPSGLTTVPASPSPQAPPTVRGTIEAGGAVQIFTTGGCSDTPVVATAAELATGVAVPVPAQQSTTFSFVVTDAAGNSSSCLASTLSYLHDSIAPAVTAASNFSTQPPSPSSTVVPQLLGTVEAGAQVSVHLTSDCSDPVVAAGSAAQLAAGLPVPMAANATSEIWVRLTDVAGNTSSCQDTTVRFTHDSSPPEPPTAMAVSPASPSSQTSPAVSGTIEAGATVQIYANGSCTGTPVAGSAAELAAGIAVPVPSNTTTIFTVRVTDSAGNISACFPTGLTYVHDAVAPGLPSGLSTDPAIASANASPTVKGTAEAGTTVEIYTSAGCASTPVRASAAELAAGVAVAVPTEQSTTFSFVVTDAAGNASSCLTSGLSYLHDSMPPAAPTLTGTTPASPSTAVAVSVAGSTEADAVVRVFTNASCTALPNAVGSADGAGMFSISALAATNATTSFFATATDAAGNTSPCSAAITFQNDQAGPVFTVPPLLTSGNRRLDVSWSAPFDAASAVASYDLAWCEGDGCAPPATPQEPGLSTSTTSWTLTGLTNCAPHTVFVRATDTLGNVGDWSSSNATPIIATPNTLSVSLSPGRALLSWNSVSFATGYEYCYSSATQFACNNGTVVGPTTGFGAVVAPLPAAVRYFAARALDGTCVGNMVRLTAARPSLSGTLIHTGSNGSRIGSLIITPGDLDGDGLTDIVYTNPASGRLYGRSPARATNLYSPLVPGGGGGIGPSLSSMGDLDGDGRPEIVAGGPLADMGGTGNGAVSFLSGARGTVLRTAYGDDGEGLGRSVAGIEDLDGDGFTDAVAGSSDRVRLISGATGATILQIPSPEAGDDFGRAVASIGTASGQPRFVVGAPLASPPGGPAGGGSVYLYAGTNTTPIARVNGSVADAGFGSAVHGVGDLSGDGVGDFLVAATTSSSITKVFAYSGSDGALLYSIDAESTAGSLGISAAPAGDIDGDGRADYLLGDPTRHKLKIYSGIDGTMIREVVRTKGFFGTGVAAADTDGDGRPDYYGGAPNERDATDPEGVKEGYLYEYRGVEGLVFAPRDRAEAPDRRFIQRRPLITFAGAPLTFTSMSQTGGFLISRVPTPNSGTASLSSAGVYTSGTTSAGVLDTLRVYDGLTVETVDARVAVLGFADSRQIAVSGLPTSVGSVGDVNCDGKADYFAARSTAAVGGLSSAGNVTIYSGDTGAVLHSIDGTVAFDSVGTAVVGLGDLDGDGCHDFAVGARGVNSSQGQVSVYSGASGSTLYAPLLGPSGSASPQFGDRLARMGDVDGDGKDDFLVGAPGVDGAAGTNTGAVFVHSGATGALIHQLEGTGSLQNFGKNVGAGGDLNGDGVPDYIVGVPNAFESAGFASAHSGLNGVELFQINGSTPGEMFGSAVSLLPDFTGGGVAELFIGNSSTAPRYNVLDGTTRAEIYEVFALQNFAILGDLNGDGASDFIVGDGNSGLNNRGIVRLYSGKDGVLVKQTNGSVTSELLGRAVGAGGDINGDGSNDYLVVSCQPSCYTLHVMTSQLPPPPPARPTSLVATAVTSTQVDLVWVDNATDETAYIVEQRSPRSAWAQSGAALPANTTSLAVTGLTPTEQYFFRVKAIHTQGDSEWSPVLTTRMLP